MEIYHSGPSSPSHSVSPSSSSSPSPHSKLRLRAVFPLAGTLVGVEAVTVSGRQRTRRKKKRGVGSVGSDGNEEKGGGCVSVAAAVDLLLLSFAPTKVKKHP